MKHPSALAYWLCKQNLVRETQPGPSVDHAGAQGVPAHVFARPNLVPEISVRRWPSLETER